MTRFPPPTVSQVKKLQVMLRQANDQLERTMMEKQNLEDSVKVSNEETAAKVRTRQTYFQTKDQKLSTLFLLLHIMNQCYYQVNTASS